MDMTYLMYDDTLGAGLYAGVGCKNSIEKTTVLSLIFFGINLCRFNKNQFGLLVSGSLRQQPPALVSRSHLMHVFQLLLFASFPESDKINLSCSDY